jgi:hypothetical protein
MTQLSPEQLRAKRMMDKRDIARQQKEREQQKRKLEMRGKKVINGRVYTEKAICRSKHDALKLEREIRAEESDIPTAVSLSAKGWTVFALAE